MIRVYKVNFLGCYGPVDETREFGYFKRIISHMVEIDTSLNILAGDDAMEAVDAAKRKWAEKVNNCGPDAPINKNRTIKVQSIEMLCSVDTLVDIEKLTLARVFDRIKCGPDVRSCLEMVRAMQEEN